MQVDADIFNRENTMNKSSNPKSLVVLGDGSNPIGRPPASPQRRGAQGVNRQSSSTSLEFLPADGSDGERRVNSAGSEGKSKVRLEEKRKNSASERMQRSDSASGRRSNTPTKQVMLQTAKKKDSGDDISFGDFDWKEYEALENSRLQSGKEEKLNDQMKDLSLDSAAAAALPPSKNKRVNELLKRTSSQEKVRSSGDEGDDEDESSSGEEEDEKIKAPNELLMEFVGYIMEEEWQDAEKLCKMILQYEPDNKEALEYHPLILEKIKMEEEESTEEESSDEDDDEDDDEDESSTETEDDEDGDENSSKPDSGISSANEDNSTHKCH